MKRDEEQIKSFFIYFIHVTSFFISSAHHDFAFLITLVSSNVSSLKEAYSLCDMKLIAIIFFIVIVILAAQSTSEGKYFSNDF